MTYGKVDEISVITARKLVEAERKRLIDVPKKPDYKAWLQGREYPLDWMKEQFGETLIEKDGLTHPNGRRVDEADCNVCGREVEPDEKLIFLCFSFCDEYSCGMNICSVCLRSLSKMLEETE